MSHRLPERSTRWQWHSLSRCGNASPTRNQLTPHKNLHLENSCTYNIAGHDTPQRPYQVVDLPGACATDSVGNTNAVDTNLVHSAVDGQQIDEVGTERILGAEADLLALALDKLNDFQRRVLDVCHVLSVAVFAEVARGTNDDVETVDTSLDGDFGIGHAASHVSENLGLETKLADGLAVGA